MPDPSLPPSSRDDAPIDAEFEPAKPKAKPKATSRKGPGWIAFGVLALTCLGLSAVGAGFVPGFTPGSDQAAALETELEALKAGRSDTAVKTANLGTDVATLKSRADSLQADRTRAVTEIRALREELETLEADISTLQRARIAGLAETSDETETAPIEQPDLAELENRLTALEDAMVSQLGTYDNALEVLKLRLTDLETQAQGEGLATATSSNARTEAALALSAIEAAARRGRPFLSAHQKLSAAMPSNQAVERLAPIASKAIPTLADLRASFPALIDHALDQDARDDGASSNWMRGIFGDGIQVRREGETTPRDQLDQAQTALTSGDLSAATSQIRALDPDLQAVFTDWLNNADDRHMLEETLEALRLTMIAEERP